MRHASARGHVEECLFEARRVIGSARARTRNADRKRALTSCYAELREEKSEERDERFGRDDAVARSVESSDASRPSAGFRLVYPLSVRQTRRECTGRLYRPSADPPGPLHRLAMPPRRPVAPANQGGSVAGPSSKRRRKHADESDDSAGSLQNKALGTARTSKKQRGGSSGETGSDSKKQSKKAAKQPIDDDKGKGKGKARAVDDVQSSEESQGESGADEPSAEDAEATGEHLSSFFHREPRGPLTARSLTPPPLQSHRATGGARL